MIRFATPEDLHLLAETENDAGTLFMERFHPEQWWPASRFQRGLLKLEDDLGLNRHGRRLQVTADLTPAK